MRRPCRMVVLSAVVVASMAGAMFSPAWADPVTVADTKTAGPFTLEGSTTVDPGASGAPTAPTAPTGRWCATAGGFGACGNHQSDGYLAPHGIQPGVCAWGLTPSSTSDPNCVNGRACVVAATANVVCR